ncbi:MAG: restriction endonuclease subunit S, partial [Alistipes sp.]|nr:restriction endonuclease subunit S [Alistipes sp.]
KVVHASVPSIEKITIPLPPLDVQTRYADVLDNFEAICTDLNNYALLYSVVVVIPNLIYPFHIHFSFIELSF